MPAKERGPSLLAAEQQQAHALSKADADTLARLAERYLGRSAGSATENTDELRRASADAREMLADEAMPKFIGSKARDARLSPPPPR